MIRVLFDYTLLCIPVKPINKQTQSRINQLLDSESGFFAQFPPELWLFAPVAALDFLSLIPQELQNWVLLCKFSMTLNISILGAALSISLCSLTLRQRSVFSILSTLYLFYYSSKYTQQIFLPNQATKFYLFYFTYPIFYLPLGPRPSSSLGAKSSCFLNLSRNSLPVVIRLPNLFKNQSDGECRMGEGAIRIIHGYLVMRQYRQFTQFISISYVIIIMQGQKQSSLLQIVKDDPYLEPFQETYLRLRAKMDAVIGGFQGQGGLEELSKSYRKYGLHKLEGEGNVYLYKQWAPEVKQISIFGDFNNWNRNQHFAIKGEFGQWECKFTTEKPIEQFSKVKVQVKLQNDKVEDRIPAWINFTHQNQDKSYDGAYVTLGSYKFKYPKPEWENKNVRIYESHIGMSGVEPKIHSYQHFKDEVLPIIHAEGYNVIQLMAILQHPYYGSFGYHVSNFFSVSSKFGKPSEFKELVDEAHRRGIKIIIDLVHAHAAKNVLEGINFWDGTDYQYFHGGEAGTHSQWDSRIFNYQKYEVLRFLLSNIRFWLEEYNTDGFRFDGVTSILYKHHGINYGFTGNYHQYFNSNLDEDAVVYLMMANLLAKSVDPNVILVAEDVSGFPGLCRSIEDGGIGFNFRLAMAIPDMWIKLLKQVRDEDWDISAIVHQLTNRRWKQNCICYAESHDQALVGDKTLSMWLFDAEIYTNMSVLNEETLRIFRGMALHKMIRLVTFALGGQGYLNFMGNQFGHPEWIDFPREGNNWSYHYCRRMWNLSEDKDLRYKYLLSFDKSMIRLDIDYNVLNAEYQFIRTKHNSDKVLVFEKDNLLFVFNWHPTQSYQSYPIYTKNCKQVSVFWSTDDGQFGGHCRVAHQSYKTEHVDNFVSKFLLYLPNRCAIVFKIHQEGQLLGNSR